MIAARIACLDLDTFFVSVERLFDPSLVGRPVVVGATGWRGVVVSASYEVRKLGVRSGMSVAEARRLAPDAVYVAPRHGVYGDYAARVKEVLLRYTPVVQTASIDEFFLDFRGCEAYWRRPQRTAFGGVDTDDDATIERTVRAMRQEIQDVVSLPASCGVGSTRPIAKMASGVAKPAGVRMVRAGEELAFVDDLPARKFPGIGPVAEERLRARGVETLGQLLVEGGPEAEAVRAAVFPAEATVLGADRPAFLEHDEAPDGSLSNERTFHADVGDDETVEAQLRALTERVCWRARRRGVKARTVSIKLRYSDFDTLGRSKTIQPTDAEKDVLPTVYELYRRAKTRPLAVRLLGVKLSNFVGDEPQLGLFHPPPTPGPAIDQVRARFGYDAIRWGAVVDGGRTSREGREGREGTAKERRAR